MRLPLVVALACAACGGSKSPPVDAKEIERYVNVELAVPIGELWYVQHGLAKLSVDAFDSPPVRDGFAMNLRTNLLPRLELSLAGARKAHPPAAMVDLHARFLALVTEYRDECAQLAAAVAAADREKFAAAHAALMSTTGHYEEWQRAFGAFVDGHGAKVGDVPGPDELPKPPAQNTPQSGGETVPPSGSASGPP